MSKVLEVVLKATLKGDDTYYHMGSVITGPIDDLPKAIQDAVKLKKRYVEVREQTVVEVPPEETTGTVGDQKESAVKEAEGAADAKPKPKRRSTPKTAKKTSQSKSGTSTRRRKIAKKE